MEKSKSNVPVTVYPAKDGERGTGIWRDAPNACYQADFAGCDPLNLISGQPDVGFRDQITRFVNSRILKYIPLTVHVYENLSANSNHFVGEHEEGKDHIVYAIRIPRVLGEDLEAGDVKVPFKR